MDTLFRIETLCGLFWDGKYFTYEEDDAAIYNTADEAIEAAADLKDVFIEVFQRPSRPVVIHTPVYQEQAA
jgi:hypothetical protein